MLYHSHADQILPDGPFKLLYSLYQIIRRAKAPGVLVHELVMVTWLSEHPSPPPSHGGGGVEGGGGPGLLPKLDISPRHNPAEKGFTVHSLTIRLVDWRGYEQGANSPIEVECFL